ncbi:MAG TPA: hypothetical protein ACHBX0_14530 [Arsenophonus sp.]
MVENNSLSGAELGRNLGFLFADVLDYDQSYEADITKGIAEGNLETSSHAASIVRLGIYSKAELITVGIGGGSNLLIQVFVPELVMVQIN